MKSERNRVIPTAHEYSPVRTGDRPLPSSKVLYDSRVEARIEALRARVQAVMPLSGRFVWEVGCGHGHFLTAFAANHPDLTCLGIDIVSDRIERARRKARRAKLPNLHFLIAEAGEFLEALPLTAKFSSVYILFPDPWPKRRHHKNRLMQSPFLNAAAEKGEPGAPLYFRTDFAPYFTQAKTAVQATHDWQLVDETWPFETDTVFQARASTYFSLVARKRVPA
ncbi:MAG: tRNA (guanosine(46)-N7)-methyltransferase TrmB [Opitutaceae bacterium]